MSRFNVMPRACNHTWAELCIGCWGNHFTPYWRVYICVHCYAKQEVPA